MFFFNNVFRHKVGPKQWFLQCFQCSGIQKPFKISFLSVFSLAWSHQNDRKFHPLKLRHPKIVEKSRKHHLIGPNSGLGAKPLVEPPPAKADTATAILTNVIEDLVWLFAPQEARLHRQSGVGGFHSPCSTYSTVAQRATNHALHSTLCNQTLDCTVYSLDVTRLPTWLYTLHTWCPLRTPHTTLHTTKLYWTHHPGQCWVDFEDSTDRLFDFQAYALDNPFCQPWQNHLLQQDEEKMLRKNKQPTIWRKILPRLEKNDPRSNKYVKVKQTQVQKMFSSRFQKQYRQECVCVDCSEIAAEWLWPLVRLSDTRKILCGCLHSGKDGWRSTWSPINSCPQACDPYLLTLVWQSYCQSSLQATWNDSALWSWVLPTKGCMARLGLSLQRKGWFYLWCNNIEIMFILLIWYIMIQ